MLYMPMLLRKKGVDGGNVMLEVPWSARVFCVLKHNQEKKPV